MPTLEGWLREFGFLLGWGSIVAATFFVDNKESRAEQCEQQAQRPSTSSDLLRDRYEEAIRDLYEEDDADNERQEDDAAPPKPR